ncbi:hypothetical protein RB623_14175 [Mesorhizobium sp. LHD-90]|uniref:hypothetical protein n=1 Tax=Mesorhizobium sp. LHD-90 TaxID=3071414 RepID=UPI0027E1D423|nr:hypothetical protein [Mesorhizobium sp. LHD-90]MDQ6435200.1 hypothetical protein [Mesorhizobium sp. LHD-90]
MSIFVNRMSPKRPVRSIFQDVFEVRCGRIPGALHQPIAFAGFSGLHAVFLQTFCLIAQASIDWRALPENSADAEA